MNFKEWLIEAERAFLEANPTNPFGTIKSRPGGGFVANRSQLWGPSAQYGRPDTMMPWEKPLPAVLTGIGQSFQDSLGRSPNAVPELSPYPKGDGVHTRWGALPLQIPEEWIPEEFQISSRNKLGMLNKIRSMLGEGPQAVQSPRIHKGEVSTGETGESSTQVGSDKDNEQKFRLIDQELMGNDNVIHKATEFTEALLHFIHVQNMFAEGVALNYDWKDPEILPNLTDAIPPLYEAIFRFSLSQDKQWGSVKQAGSDKIQNQQDKWNQRDLIGAQDALNPVPGPSANPNPAG